MKHTGQILFLFTLCACTASSLPLSDADRGKHTVYCSGDDSSWDECDRKARETCGEQGYDEEQKYEDEGAFVAYGSARVLPDRRLKVHCRQ